MSQSSWLVAGVLPGIERIRGHQTSVEPSAVFTCLPFGRAVLMLCTITVNSRQDCQR
jgi:hypothetical protein